MFNFQRSPVAIPLLLLGIGCCVIQPISAFAVPQDGLLAAESVTASSTQDAQTAQYLITVSQYSLKGVDVSAMSADNIWAAIKTEKAPPFETIILSAIAGVESRASFGRSVTVTTGTTTTRNGKVRNTEYRNIGTILTVGATPEGQQVRLSLKFTTSGHSGEGTDDSPPDATSTEIEKMQLFELGKPTLIGATTAGESSFMFLTVSRQ